MGVPPARALKVDVIALENERRSRPARQKRFGYGATVEVEKGLVEMINAVRAKRLAFARRSKPFPRPSFERYAEWLNRLALRRLRAEVKESHVDSLTGAYNLNFVKRVLPGRLSELEKAGTPLGVVGLDFMRFKAINEKAGHAEGDVALRQAVKVMEEHARGQDFVIRVGGDEFYLLLPGVERLQDVKMVVDRINGALGKNKLLREIGRKVEPGYKIQFRYNMVHIPDPSNLKGLGLPGGLTGLADITKLKMLADPKFPNGGSKPVAPT